MHDDRSEFQDRRRANSVLLGQDRALSDDARKIIVDADKYDYSYLWTWMGVPIIQLPADIVVMQEIIWRERPDVIIETGVARGGSLIMYASMLSLIGQGQVIGIDIDIRKHNRDAIETHIMAPLISLIEGSSVASEIVGRVREQIPPGAKTMVVLDSDHSKMHVARELIAYSPLVTLGQYLVVADTALGELTPDQTPTKRAAVWYPGDEPLAAVNEFLASTDAFEKDGEINGKMILSSSRGGYLRRTRG